MTWHHHWATEPGAKLIRDTPQDQSRAGPIGRAVFVMALRVLSRGPKGSGTSGPLGGIAGKDGSNFKRGWVFKKKKKKPPPTPPCAPEATGKTAPTVCG